MIYSAGSSGGNTFYAPPANNDFSWTGINADSEPANPETLYDFPARGYGIQGRWPSPDPLGIGAVDPANPQSWNRYAYVMNNPLAMSDPTGLCALCIGPGDGGGDGEWDNAIMWFILNEWPYYVWGPWYGYPSPPPPPKLSPPPPGGYGAGFDPYGAPCGIDPGIWEHCQISGVPIGLACRFEIIDCELSPGTFRLSATALGTPPQSPPQTMANSKPKPSFWSCTFSAGTGTALATTALDAIGIIPGGGNVLHGVQLVAGVGALGLSAARGSFKDVAVGGASTGLAFADAFHETTNIAIHGVEIVPVLGNIVSAGATYEDILGNEGVISSYKACLSGGR